MEYVVSQICFYIENKYENMTKILLNTYFYNVHYCKITKSIYKKNIWR